jgi:hypothetical protein
MKDNGEKGFNWGYFIAICYLALCVQWRWLILPFLLAIYWGWFVDARDQVISDEERERRRKEDLKWRLDQQELNRKSDENFHKYENIRKQREQQREQQRVNTQQVNTQQVNNTLQKNNKQGNDHNERLEARRRARKRVIQELVAEGKLRPGIEPIRLPDDKLDKYFHEEYKRDPRRENFTVGMGPVFPTLYELNNRRWNK